MQSNQWFYLRGEAGQGGLEGSSPDIILGGRAPDPDYRDYDKVFNQTADYKTSNYVYVRAKNLGSELAVGDVTVFVTYLSNLTNQGLWTRLHTTDGRDSTNIAADASKVVVNGAPLVWEPDGAPAPGIPYCLIAEISDDGHPRVEVPSSVNDQSSFDAWIAKQPQLAYLVVKDAPVVVVPAPVFTWEGHVNLGNSQPVQLSTSLTCTSGSVGGSLSYVFDENDTNGVAIGVGKTRYQLGTSYSQQRTVPAYFNSKVTIKFMPASLDDAKAEFEFQVTTEATPTGGSTGTSHPTLVAQYQLDFGQVQQG